MLQRARDVPIPAEIRLYCCTAMLRLTAKASTLASEFGQMAEAVQ
jgi:hypothetical protein